MPQPEGFKVEGKEHMICKLKKSLYGLEQTSQRWLSRFDEVVTSFGYGMLWINVYISKLVGVNSLFWY